MLTALAQPLEATQAEVKMTLKSNEVCAITGASGYVGSILTDRLKMNMPVFRMVRKADAEGDIDWSFSSTTAETARILKARAVTTLVHAAWDMKAATLRELDRTCVRGSAALFEAAMLGGVKRIIFISSISAFEGCRSAYGKTKLAVERLLRDRRALVLRPGLVFGPAPGGVFGGIRRQVCQSRWVPLIGDGRSPQYLLHETTLAESTLSAAQGTFDHLQGRPITLAHSQPWPFKELVQSIADAEQRKVTMIPIPWRALFCGMRLGEMLKVPLPFRSDSVLSFVYSDQRPDFSPMESLHISAIPYAPSGPDLREDRP